MSFKILVLMMVISFNIYAGLFGNFERSEVTGKDLNLDRARENGVSLLMHECDVRGLELDYKSIQEIDVTKNSALTIVRLGGSCS